MPYTTRLMFASTSRTWVCDFLACSTYKFFGPHQGVIWGRRQLLEDLRAYKLRPAADTLPDKWMTGTQSHEAIAGVIGAIDYMTSLGRQLEADDTLTRRQALDAAYKGVANYEVKLGKRLLDGIQALSGFKVWGITDRDQWSQRLPTFSLTHSQHTAAQLLRFGPAWHLYLVRQLLRPATNGNAGP